MWLDRERFDCARASEDEREANGHDAPASRAVPWDPPDGFYVDPVDDRGRPIDDDPARFRCPEIFLSGWGYAVLDIHQASTLFHSSPVAGGVALWPARLREALLFLENQYARRRLKAAEERAANAKKPSPR